MVRTGSREWARVWRNRKSSLVAAAAVLGLAVVSAAGAELRAEPASITFDAPADKASIRVLSNGEALGGQSISRWRLIASEHAYNHMLLVEKKGGTLIVRPSDHMEVGHYTLRISTAKGEVDVDVYAPLSSLDSIVERKAREMGVSVDEARKQLGLATENPRSTIEITLPAVYYEGQGFKLDVPADLGERHVWNLNGQTVLEGEDANVFEHVFTETGDYVLTYEAMKGDALMASAQAHTTVAQLPPVEVDVHTETTVPFTAPEGYATYTWTLKGEEVGTGKVCELSFGEPGEYMLECMARKAESKEYSRFRFSIRAVTP